MASWLACAEPLMHDVACSGQYNGTRRRSRQIKGYGQGKFRLGVEK
jgi:hypothetical protein